MNFSLEKRVRENIVVKSMCSNLSNVEQVIHFFPLKWMLSANSHNMHNACLSYNNLFGSYYDRSIVVRTWELTHFQESIVPMYMWKTSTELKEWKKAAHALKRNTKIRKWNACIHYNDLLNAHIQFKHKSAFTWLIPNCVMRKSIYIKDSKWMIKMNFLITKKEKKKKI